MTDLMAALEALEATREPAVIAATRREPRPLDVPMHHHARGQLMGVRAGLITIETEAGARALPTAEAIWVPPNHPHSARSAAGFDGWSIFFAQTLCARAPRRPRALVLSGLLREAALRASSWNEGAFDASRQRLSDVMLDEIASLPTPRLSLPMPRDHRLRAIAEAFAADPSDERGLEDWARWGGLSARTLSRRFAQETGCSFSDWRRRARLLRAIELLDRGLSVTTVAVELGYSSVSAFITLYRRVFGETPGRRLSP